MARGKGLSLEGYTPSPSPTDRRDRREALLTCLRCGCRVQLAEGEPNPVAIHEAWHAKLEALEGVKP